MNTRDAQDKTTASNTDLELPCGAGGLNRRAVLKTATGAMSAMAGATSALADAVPTGFGAPLVELHVPAGALTLEQKEAMIKGITGVMLRATGLPPDQTRKLWVQIFETAEGGWGRGGEVVIPRAK
jgi:phenylpyruvate tautomerase PptA (4-oxalocrotonate tautomerase family)